MLALLAFLALYLGLMGWLGWVLYRCVLDLRSGGAAWIFMAPPAAFLLLFLAKGLFYVKRGTAEGLTEVTAETQPDLLAFVHRVADDVGAPRPHRVFLSPRVNAGVFYDLGLRDYILPTKKNLEIGLGLVNALSVDEFKAVLAHEFGHFSQSTMQIGARVYLIGQVAGAIVARRDGFDTFLEGLARVDLRVMVVAWALRLVVWSIRALLDTAFRGLLLVQRALSRQMEFQADLVAVSVTGSDSLICALSRAGVADEMWGPAANFAVAQAKGGRVPADLFALQDRLLERHREIRGDASLGATPSLPGEDGSRARVFKVGLADAPQMWSTHPPNYEREENAKRVYIPSVRDPRSAWVLFREPEAVRREMTRSLLRSAEVVELAAEAPTAELLEHIDQQFEHAQYERRYRGAYLHRALTRHAAEPDALIGPAPADIGAALEGLYPPTLPADLERVEQLREERASLEGLIDGFLTAPGGVIRFRGRELHKSELSALLEEVRVEVRAAEGAVEQHDAAVRAAHLAAARGSGWDLALKGLLGLVHYAEHVGADLSDAHGLAWHVFGIISADGKISSAELNRLLSVCTTVSEALAAIHRQRAEVVLPASVREALKVESWAAVLSDQAPLGAPSADALASGWLNHMNDWVGHYTGALSALRRVALEQLVRTENTVRLAFQSSEPLGEAPEPARLPPRYPRLLSGQERPRQKRLDAWDRFILADGPFAAAGRLAVALLVLAPPMLFSLSGAVWRDPEVHVHNGLGIPVEVQIGDERRRLDPGESRSVRVEPGPISIEARDPKGRSIERFDAEIVARKQGYAYNVAGASALVEYVVLYGVAKDRGPRSLGAPRWIPGSSDYIFEEPPKEVSGKGRGTTRTVLWTHDSAEEAVSWVDDAQQREAMVRAHALWDAVDSGGYEAWLALAEGSRAELIRERLSAEPRAVQLLRAQMDSATPDERAALCAQHEAARQKDPQDSLPAYLAIRCMPDGPAQSAAFLEAAARFPTDLWLRTAAVIALDETGRFAEALRAAETALALEDVPAALRQSLAGEVLTLRRWLAPSPLEAQLAHLYEDLPYLQAVLRAEREPKQPKEPEIRALWMIAHGELAAAEAAGLHRDPALSLLLGASDGASSTAREAMFALASADMVSTHLALYALAAMEREGVDSEPLRQALVRAYPERDQPLLALIRPGLAEDPARLDAALANSTLGRRCVWFAVGAVLLGDQAPPHWREQARKGLLVTDRPYLRE